MKVSVLMSTYCKEHPEYLNASLESIWTSQTRKPDEIVLVEDGPLTPELYAVVDDWKQSLGDALNIVVNETNQGLARSLNNGLEKAMGEIIVRMDSDDIAFPERIEEEMEIFEKNPDIDVVGSWISEFVDSTDNIVSQRKVPKTSAEIYEFGKYRSPMNHPSVAFRRDVIIKNGCYEHFLLFEDYCLWVRLLKNGCKFYNIQKPLLWFRSSLDMFARRGGLHYAVTEFKFQCFMYRLRYISLPILIRNSSMRFLARLIPNKLRKMIYMRAVR